jgi:hypothetical protein
MEFDFTRNLDFSGVHEAYENLYEVRQTHKRARRIRRVVRVTKWALIGVGAYAIYNHFQEDNNEE